MGYRLVSYAHILSMPPICRILLKLHTKTLANRQELRSKDSCMIEECMENCSRKETWFGFITLLA